MKQNRHFICFVLLFVDSSLTNVIHNVNKDVSLSNKHIIAKTDHSNTHETTERSQKSHGKMKFFSI